MDRTVVRLVELYDEMYDELRAEMEVLGGTIDEFDPEDQLMYVTVEPKLQEYAEEYIADLIARYNKKRKDIIRRDVFMGVKNILSEDGRY